MRQFVDKREGLVVAFEFKERAGFEFYGTEPKVGAIWLCEMSFGYL